MSKYYIFGMISIVFITSCNNLFNYRPHSVPPQSVILEKVSIRYMTHAIITWSESSAEDFLYYKIFVSSEKDFSDTVNCSVIHDKKVLTHTVDCLKPNKSYYIKIAVYATNFEYSTSNTEYFKTQKCRCGDFTYRKKGKMILIPRGCYRGKYGFYATLSYDYYMDSTEVTEKEWFRVMKDSSVQSTTPITNIGWYETIIFCNKKSRRDKLSPVYSYDSTSNDTITGELKLHNLKADFTKNGYRLPTEDEWEYAYRAGEFKEYFWGKEGNTNLQFPKDVDYPVSTKDSLNINKYAIWNGTFISNSNLEKKPHPVATKTKSNRWHLYDMAGNVEEFVWDNYGPRKMDRLDYKGHDVTPMNPRYKTFRGGSFNSSYYKLTAWYRSDNIGLEDSKKNTRGFRVVRNKN